MSEAHFAIKDAYPNKEVSTNFNESDVTIDVTVTELDDSHIEPARMLTTEAIARQHIVAPESLPAVTVVSVPADSTVNPIDRASIDAASIDTVLNNLR